MACRETRLTLTQNHQDFNYHANIYSTDNHLYRTATSGGVPFGSGLNTLSNLPFSDFRRIKWSTCSDASSNDCLTPKGFTFMRVALTPETSTTSAVYADFYNLHSDAGTEPADNTARQSNINQVASYISTWSTGNAVLIFGDTNSRYSRTVDTAIRALLSAGHTDPWVEFQRGNIPPTAETFCSNPSTNDACETVDKLFYRSSPLVSLSAESFAYASKLFLQPDGVSVLSDHNPIHVNFTWSSTAFPLRQSPFWGGPHGNWFSDVPTLSTLLSSASSQQTTKTKPSVITFRGASRLDGVSLNLLTTGGATPITTTLSHGSTTSGSAVSLTLAADEYWTSARLCQSQKDSRTRIFYIQAVTSAGRSLAAGTVAGDCVTYSAPTEGGAWQIVGFLGQDGAEVDQLAFVYALR